MSFMMLGTLVNVKCESELGEEVRERESEERVRLQVEKGNKVKKLEKQSWLLVSTKSNLYFVLQ